MLEISEWTRHTEVKSTHGIPAYRIRMRVRAVRPAQSPDPAPGVTRPVSRVTHLSDPVPGVARPLLRTPGLCWLGPYGGDEWGPVTSWLGRQTCQVSLLPSHVSQRSPPLFPSVLCDTNCFYSCHHSVEHTALVMAVSGFCCPAEVLQKHTGLWAGRREQLWSLLSVDGLLEGEHSGSLTCCPLAFWLIHVPCNQLPR